MNNTATANHDDSPMKRLEAAPADTSERALALKDVSVYFRSYEHRPTSLKEMLLKVVLERKLRHFSTFPALTDISFEVNRGEVVAFIGSNGAGKTTLLRTIAGVLKPTSGTISVNGRIDSLIQLGAGFDPDLNAIENIYLNGSLYQRSRSEMAERMDDILSFAELHEFAQTPIKYYSSGMSARLGFSVSIDRDPDIMLVDEVLGVGDQRFQEKCQGVFERFLEQRKTIIMVSHSMSAVKKMAHRVIVLSQGKIIYIGDPQTAIEIYESEDYKTRLSSAS